MEYLQLLGAIIGLSANIPLLIGIYKNKVEQNFVTWTLWFFLDFISVTTIFLQDGNYYLPLVYTIGSFSVACLVAFKKQFTWTWIETLVTILVFICIIVWWKIGPRAATIASVAAMVIASIPQIYATALRPSMAPTKIYLLFCLASILSLLGGTEWSVEQKLYPAGILSFALLITILSMRKEKVQTVSV